MLSSLFTVPPKTNKVTALVDNRNERTLIHGNPQECPGPLRADYGCEGQTVMVRKYLLTLQTGHSPPFLLPDLLENMRFYLSNTKEHIRH